jgi:ABC-2 type transport system permease protein
MRLLRSEFLRARSRRLVPMVIIGGLFGIVVGLGITAIYADEPTAAEVAEAQTRYDNQLQKCLEGRFLGPDAVLPAGFDNLEEYCRDNVGPYLDGVVLRDLDTILQGVATFVILLGTLLAASLGGADWTSNTMTTLLTWEPRRIRVFFARALVVAVFVAVIITFLQVVFSGVYALVAATRGSTMFLPSHFWVDVAATIGRVSVMATALGLVAYVVAMIGRSTVASLGALFGYLILFEGVIAGFRPSIQGSLLVRGASVIVSQQPILDFSDGYGYADGYDAPAVLMDVQRAWIVVAIYVVVLTALSLLQYQRRDVT